MNGYEDTECEKYFTPPDKTPQQQIDVTHTLTCDKCEEWFYSNEAFPSPQLCPKCKLVERVAAIIARSPRELAHKLIPIIKEGVGGEQ